MTIVLVHAQVYAATVVEITVKMVVIKDVTIVVEPPGNQKQLAEDYVQVVIVLAEKHVV